MANKDVSLLPKTPLEGTIWGKLITWVLSVGRYIIVFTELIVIGAFLSRFWLDRKEADLSEQIRQRQAIITSINQFEKEFHFFQTRLSAAGNFIKKDIQPMAPMEPVVKSLPADIIVSNFSFTETADGGRISLSTLVFSEASLAAFVDNLLARDDVVSVGIGTVEREQGVAGMKIQFDIGFGEVDNA